MTNELGLQILAVVGLLAMALGLLWICYDLWRG